MSTAPAIISARDAGGPPVGVVLPLKSRGAQQGHPLIGADVTVVVNIMADAFRGYRRRWEDLLDDVIERDLRCSGITAGRILAITGRPYSIKPPLGFDTDKDAQEIAEICSRIVANIRAGVTTQGEGGGWSTVLANIASGAPRGISVNEMEWGLSAKGLHVPKALHWRHGRRFGFDDLLRIVLDDNGSERKPLDTFAPDKFVIHSPTGGIAKHATRRGFLLGCVLPSLVKRTDVRYWLKATERWGQPLPLVEAPAGATPEVRDAALELANKLATNFVGALWGGVKLAQVPGSGTLNPAIYRELADFANLEMAIHVLGNNLNVEIQGGSFAAATAAGVMRYDILASDLAELDDAITTQILEPIVRYNWPGAPVPVYVSELRSQQPLTTADVQEGIVSPDEYRSSKGYEPKPDGAGSDYRVPVVQVGADLGTPTPDVLDGADPATPAAETALNGAQVTAMQGIIESAAAGKIPRETAIALLTTAFPIDEAKANAILSNIQQGFVPTPDAGKPPATQPPGGADAEAPLAGSPKTQRAPWTSQTSEDYQSAIKRALLRSLAGSEPSRSSDS